MRWLMLFLFATLIGLCFLGPVGIRFVLVILLIMMVIGLILMWSFSNDNQKDNPDLKFTDTGRYEEGGPHSDRFMFSAILTIVSLILIFALSFPVMIHLSTVNYDRQQHRQQSHLNRLKADVAYYQKQQSLSLDQMHRLKSGSNAYKDAQISYYRNHDKWLIAQNKVHHYQSQHDGLSIHLSN